MLSRLLPLIAVLPALAACAGSGPPSTQAVAPTGSASPARVPSAAAAPKNRARIWAVGDGANGAHAADVVKLIARGHPDRLLYLGDVYPMGTRAGFAGYARDYGKLAAITEPTIGNHDWPDRDTGYFPYWRRVHGSAPEWYTFNAGGWQVIELNSQTDRRAEQLSWLHRQLRARGTCRIAFWHRPRFSAGPHGDNTDMNPYWQALQGHARLVISGHDHNMQRFAPRAGLIQIVSGAGGFTHYAISRSHPGLAFADNSHWGALRIDLSPGRASIAFVATTGTVLDSQVLNCST